MDAGQPDRPRVIEQVEGGPELVVWGDAARERVGREILARREEVAARGLRMMGGFLKESFRPSGFFLDGIEVYSDRAPETGDFSLRWSFTPGPGDGESGDEFGYTFFDVHFHLDGSGPEPWWPYRMVIGFH